MATSKIAKVGRNSTTYIRDEGSVAPGVTVKRKFRQSEGELIANLATLLTPRHSVQHRVGSLRGRHRLDSATMTTGRLRV